MEITTYSVEFVASGGDAGLTFEVTCPKCGDKVQVADYSWWEKKCSCGYTWSVSVIATGSKSDEG